MATAAPTKTSVFLEPSATRLVTIIAHVDHGKTTLADSLIEYNGIISERLAGTVRYLDSDPEEQRRGITMRSSAIGLKHAYKLPKADIAVPHIVHLLDCPGHTDFSMEVSSSLVACDSCLIVLDAVEGMAPRTHQVLREAYMHRLVPVLVINKIDRLCTNLGLSPTEGYMRLRGLLETVNAAASAMLTSSAAYTPDNEDGDDTNYETYWSFDPAMGNVVFCSALHGWAFTSQSLARSLFRQKVLPIKPVALKQVLFSDTKYANNKLLKWKYGSDDTPLFAEYALQPLWSIYEATAAAAESLANRGQRLELTSHLSDTVLAALQFGATDPNTKVPSTREELKELQTKLAATTEEAFLRSLLRRYRPLAPVVLDTLCEYCPSPQQAVGSVRQSVLTLQTPPGHFPKSVEQWENLQSAIRECAIGNEKPTVAHVCKFVSTDRLHIRDPFLPDSGESTVLLGVARILCGSLRTDSSYHLFGPKYPSSESDVPVQRTIRLYLLMGSSFVSVPEVPAGHLCAISNLEASQFKTVTLCDSDSGMPLKGFSESQLRPLVKVWVEAESAADSDVLQHGLMKLSLADAAVEVTSTARGEQMLACLGEIHLEQSLLDLEKVYCGKEGIKLRVSDPIVDFGETTTWFEKETAEGGFGAFFDDDTQPPLRQMKIPPYNEEEGIFESKRGRSRMLLSGRGAAINLRAVPFSQSIYNHLQSLKNGKDASLNEDIVIEILSLGNALGIHQKKADESDVDAAFNLLRMLQKLIRFMDMNGNALMESLGCKNGVCIRGVSSSNGEVFHRDKAKHEGEEECEMDDGGSSATTAKAVNDALRNLIKAEPSHIGKVADNPSRINQAARDIWNKDSMTATIAGFQMAVRSGWICEEPVHNVLVVLEGVEVAVEEKNGTFVPAKPFSGGMIVSGVRIGIRSALLSRPARIIEGILRLTLHSSLAGLGSLYSVLTKRRGKVTEDTMVDGTDLLLISALIPQAESFGLATELFRKTSGEVTAPELIFSHWELLEEDPFWIPTSLEEREDFGELEHAGDTSTGMDITALKYIRQVRQRKGLVVDSNRTVVAAEKQRTIKR